MGFNSLSDLFVNPVQARSAGWTPANRREQGCRPALPLAAEVPVTAVTLLLSGASGRLAQHIGPGRK
jgi:hypothetical protein